MTENKIYFVLMCVWVGINIFITLYNIFSGKGTKKSVKQLLSDIITLKGLISSKDELVKGQVIPVEEIAHNFDTFTEKCVAGTVTTEDYYNIVNYISNIRDYFIKEDDNADSST